MARYMGIDIGSGTSKGVLLEDDSQAATVVLPTGNDYRAVGERIRERLLAGAGLEPGDIDGTVVTGHIGGISEEDGETSDILCCARGIHRLSPDVRTVIDVGGQSSQVIRVNERGQVTGFVVSEKCASGSGRFLEVVAHVLRIDLDEIGPLSLKSEHPVTFSTGCAVFGESEAISRVAEGIAKEDILAGVNRSLADKISALVNRVRLEEPCAISSGGGLNAGLVRSIEEKLGISLFVPEEPLTVIALGAAILAGEKDR